MLAGGVASIERDRPRIVMELAPCLYDGTDGFDQIVDFLGSRRYRVAHLRTGRPLPLDAATLRRHIPDGSSMNVLCLPS